MILTWNIVGGLFAAKRGSGSKHMGAMCGCEGDNLWDLLLQPLGEKDTASLGTWWRKQGELQMAGGTVGMGSISCT